MAKTNEDTELAEEPKTLLSWSFPSFEEHERSRSWYVLAVIVAILCLLYALWDRNFLFAIIVVIIGATLYQRLLRTPEEVGFCIREDGLEIIGQAFYPYKDIRNFWIIYEPPKVKDVYFMFSVGLRQPLRIPLETENPLHIRKVLSRYLPENLERETEPTIDALGRMLKL